MNVRIGARTSMDYSCRMAPSSDFTKQRWKRRVRRTRVSLHHDLPPRNRLVVLSVQLVSIRLQPDLAMECVVNQCRNQAIANAARELVHRTTVAMCSASRWLIDRFLSKMILVSCALLPSIDRKRLPVPGPLVGVIL